MAARADRRKISVTLPFCKHTTSSGRSEWGQILWDAEIAEGGTLPAVA